MKLTVLFFVALFFTQDSSAQALKWPVRKSSGNVSIVDFSPAIPVVGPTISGFGAGGEKDINIMTDPSGNLLFVTAVEGNNKIQIRDGNLNPMPNGNNLLGNRSVYESAICKMTCDVNKYIFFHYTGNYQQDSLLYSVIDMSQNGGLGNVGQKNVFVGSGFTEGMTITKQMKNGCRYLLIPGLSNDTLQLYSIMISDLGISIPLLLDNIVMHGPISTSLEIEVSPDNTKVCVSTSSSNPNDPDLIVYDFILEAGTISNRKFYNVSKDKVWGTEFSPDASKVYYQTFTSAKPSVLGRIDVNTNVNEIIDSLRSSNLSDIELAGNGKIYACSNDSAFYLSEIADPDNPVPANILYTRNSIFIDSIPTHSGLPNIIDGEPTGTSHLPTKVDFSAYNTADCQGYQFVEKSCVGTWWLWDFGDGTTSNLSSPLHHYSSEGNYDVTLRIQQCSDTVTVKYNSFVPVAGIQLSVSSNAIVCNNSPQILQVSGADSYSWSPSTGLNITTGPQVIANPSTPMIYTVTGTNVSGCTGSASITVTPVTIHPSIQVIGALNFCAGNSATLTASGGNNYLWSNGLTSPSILINAEGTYSVKVSANGCEVTDSVVIKAINPINAEISIAYTPTPICEGGSAFLTVKGNGIVSKQWYRNHKVLPGMTGDSLTVTSGGLYSVVGIDATGCRDTVFTIVDATPGLRAAYHFTQELCTKKFHFINTSTGANSYKWFVNQEKISEVGNTDYTFPENGSFLVTLIASNNTCSDTFVNNVTVSKSVRANFKTDSLCSFEKEFKNLSINGIKNFWQFGDGNSSNVSNPIHTYSSTGNYSVKLITENSGCRDSIEKKITIAQFATSAFTYNGDSCTGVFSFNPASSYAQTYSWSFGDQTFSDSLNPQHIYWIEGGYRVQLITNSGVICADSTIIKLSAPELPVNHLYIPNTFTPNDDGINDRFRIFGFSKCSETYLAIYNRWGKMIFETNNLSESWNGKFQGEAVPAGLYSYIINANGEFRQGTILVLL